MRQGETIGSPGRIRPALRRERTPDERQMWQGMGEAWTALSTLISGIAVWGLIGYGIDRLAGTRPVFFVVGVLAGNFLGIYLVYAKYFKQDAPLGAPSKQDAPLGAPSKQDAPLGAPSKQAPLGAPTKGAKDAS